MIYEAHAMPVRQRQVKESSEVAQLRAEIAMLQKQLGRLRSQVVDIVRRTRRNFDETRVPFLFGSARRVGDDPSPLECMIDDSPRSCAPGDRRRGSTRSSSGRPCGIEEVLGRKDEQYRHR